jgi:uncharacterized membrane protein
VKSVESTTRSLFKTITYRILIVVSTFIVTYLLTGHLKLSLTITIGANIINTVLYFIHERVWNQIGWGKKNKK